MTRLSQSSCDFAPTALLTDDYYASDLAWLDLKNPKFDIIFAPYETYLDDLLGVKTSYGASVLIRNEEESRKAGRVREVCAGDPGRAAARGCGPPFQTRPPDAHGSDGCAVPRRRSAHGYQAVADNLPNDPRIHQEKGTKKIFFKNFMDARVY